MKRTFFGCVFVCCSLLLSGPVTAAAIGPDPTATSVNADGTFAVATLTIAKTASLGFGGGTIYYPTATGTFGVVALSPGFTATRTSVQQVARRLATHGLVTIAIDTKSTLDLPNSRGTQLRAALNYVTGASSAAVRSHVDVARRGVGGHSMGGGGALYALAADATLNAGVAMAPWNTATTNFSTIKSPILVMTADGDTTAPPATHGLPMYNSVPTTVKKAYLQLNNAVHGTFSNATTLDERVGRYATVWAKRWIDDDARYSPFLCGTAHSNYFNAVRFDSYSSTCPF